MRWAMLGVLIFLCLPANAQTLQKRLSAEPADELAQAARAQGDAQRGAVVFHQPTVGCATCHSSSAPNTPEQTARIGPDLAKLSVHPDASDEHLVESILKPSDNIREGYRLVSVLRTDGTIVQGLRVAETDQGGLVLRDLKSGTDTKVRSSEINEVVPKQISPMPSETVNTLAGRQQFLDLVKYLIEIRDGGPSRAQELKPAPELYAFRLPDYESRVDHAGLIESRDAAAFERGEKIYQRLCVNCHGTLESPGSLPTAVRFGQQPLRNGSDPYAMYQTLTQGFGLMVPQTWMVPQQKYDVIHYIREFYLKQHNPSQFTPVTDRYLASLPAGDTFGPEPVESAPWRDMDYGPWMFNTIEVSQDGSNIAYKGLAVRLDPGPGGVARGNQWMLFDHDTMRVAAGWSHRDGSKSRFIDWQGIHFDGRHQSHPHVVGNLLFANPTGPGWANPQTGSFEDDQRVLGRDDKRYGPLPESWAEYHGMHHAGKQPIVSYQIGDMEVLERFQRLAEPASNNASESDSAALFKQPSFVRTLQLEPTAQKHSVLLATDPSGSFSVSPIDDHSVLWGRKDDASTEKSSRPSERRGRFTGSAWLQTDEASAFEMATKDFSVTARIRTTSDGVIFSKTADGPEWVPDGGALFVRGGRLTYDVGWVGAVSSSQKIDDNRWHKVALVSTQPDGKIRLFVDNKQVGQGNLAPEEPLEDAVARIGFGAPDFPKKSAFHGEIRDVRFYQRALTDTELKEPPENAPSLAARWLADSEAKHRVGPKLSVVNASDAGTTKHPDLMVGIQGDTQQSQFRMREGRLCLDIPPSTDSRTIAIWLRGHGRNDETPSVAELRKRTSRLENRVAETLTKPSPRQQIEEPADPLWPEELTTTVSKGRTNASGFAADTLTAPEQNPWLARLRFGGHDFYPGGDRMVICTWDGDVYEISGLSNLDSGESPKITWRRIASGLFQPLGVKIIDGQIHVTCRDQLVILRDSNGDGATDFFECFNNDHQVTEHFHEFAMGLQRDSEGNFYYAKSARHALPAIVPHHGTLLRVSPDGSHTEIVATGFRAANGVCLNPDGTFIVTDQEGHWTPKNRVNWVRPGGFYGNMLGYHDVHDSSNDAMQPPLCWITNDFDRSPAEPLWVTSRKWGNLTGTLLNLSYGYGKLYTIPYQRLEKSDQVQGAVCELPVPRFPTGIIRGRFHPTDGQLYVCGLYAWASSQQAKPGGLYRVRYNGQGAVAAIDVEATPGKLAVRFSDPLNPAICSELGRFRLKVWSLRRTKNYGSEHIDERMLEIASADISDDGRTLTFVVPELKPTWCYELRCRLETRGRRPIERVMHGTIHELPEK